MKTLVFALAVAVSLVGFANVAHFVSAEGEKPALTAAEKEAKKAAAFKMLMERTGGSLDVDGKGKVMFVNCQTKIPRAAIDEKVDQLKKVLRVSMETTDGSWKFGDALPKGANVALFIVNDPSLPISLVAPESQWGVLNVAKIDEGKRFGKAFVRASILTLGAGVSQFKGSPMQTVTKPEDLDRILTENLTFDALTGIMNNLKALGVTQSKRTTYRKACMEGWAAAPTNDYQKVIWEEIHSKPTNPMRIKFDPKKGE